MPGRRPKPTNLLNFQGNPGGRRLNEHEPQPPKPRRAPPAPPELGDVGKQEWKRMARILHDLGLLTGLDRGMLTAYCKSFEQWVEAVRMTDRFGTVALTANRTPVQSPYVGIANRALANMTRIAVEFGLTPAARSRVQAPPMGDAMDEDEAYMFGPRGSPGPPD